MTELNYKQTTDIIEDFMKKSGIRTYCTETCGGKCCKSCYTSKNACYKHEGRRLPCSLFVCDWLSSLIFTKKDRDKYEKMFYEIRKIIYGLQDKYRNIYFNPLTEEQIKAFKIKRSLIFNNLPNPQKIHKVITLLQNK